MIPAHGDASLEAVYIPSSAALTASGSDPCAYALGYISIDEKVFAHVSVLLNTNHTHTIMYIHEVGGYKFNKNVIQNFALLTTLIFSYILLYSK